MLDVQVYGRMSELPQACMSLFNVAEQASFDLGADWFRLMVGTALPERSDPRFCVLAYGEEIRCILPVLVGSTQVTGLTTFYSSLYRPLVTLDVRPDELARVFRGVIDDTGASSVRLDAMDPLHPSYELTLKALSLAGLKPASFFAFGNWYQSVAGVAFESYFKTLPSRTRNTVKRRGKKFTASGGRLEIVTESQALDSAIRAWVQIYQSSWKVQEPYPEFMPGLVHLCARKGWLRMGLAYYNDVPIAAQIWIVSHGRAAIYKLAYDESFAEHSAGTLLTAHLMSHVLDVDKVQEVDYLIGDDAYKKEWMNQRRERRGIVAYNLRSIRGAIGFGMQMLGSLRRRLTARQSNANLDQT